MTPLIACAEALARELHAGQQDKAGRPYVEHLAAVVGILVRRWPDAPEEAVAAAWLHDAMEDANATAMGLLREHMPDKVRMLVMGLTRIAHVTYADWIGLIASLGVEWHIRIKLADLEHNCDPARALPDSTLVQRRYRPAIAVLEAALARREGRVAHVSD